MDGRNPRHVAGIAQQIFAPPSLLVDGLGKHNYLNFIFFPNNNLRFTKLNFSFFSRYFVPAVVQPPQFW
jgi:hypothetical protein